MRYAQIRSMDISDGPGIRAAIYTQGCPIHCPGCHNESIWDFNGGKEFTNDTIKELIDLAKPDYIVGLSILGGEPFSRQNLDDLLSLVLRFKKIYPNKTIWIWTGYTFEQVCDIFWNEYTRYTFKALEPLKSITRPKEWMPSNFLQFVDVLVDGPWIAARKNLNLKYAGSDNQRVIDMKKTLEKGEVVLYDNL